MNPNPFHPTFGRSPTVVAGRKAEINSFSLALAEGPSNPWRTALISGTRGIGKTVLLNQLENAAAAQGWVTVRAHVGKKHDFRPQRNDYPPSNENFRYSSTNPQTPCHWHWF
ncbi:ATP-binding protein [Corynebacterium sp. sy039]|uniref:ATP-binding protein n=1 Tax=Corynebacterium sp. sy039 TaxID=2599641 RepID=UPI001FEE732C|nr:ATP-binding protein [Corynebacterium sp. sy039]